MILFFQLFLRRVSKNKYLFVQLFVLFAISTIIYLLFWPKNDPSERDDLHELEHSIESKYLQEFSRLNPIVRNWGENGQPVNLNDEENALAKKSFSSAAFNVYISDRISPNRSLPDPRPYECATVNYNLSKLGKASIVIIFTNEIWSALIRTIWSVVNRSPKVLLKEIILVDDFSDKPELKDPLDRYVELYFKGLVKIMRLSERGGLIRARLVGARVAVGDVLIFLDSHVEATDGWLEPLLKTIYYDRRNVVCPVIDIISDKNLEYVGGNRYNFQVGGFIWSGHFIWLDTNEDKIRRNPTTPLKSPTMAGGLFAIDRNYFFEIGSYDEQMEIWGGENLELSFRLWQCGGKLFIHPCSHVGHIFRDYQPYSFLGKDSHGLNTLRTVLVWMEKYSRYFFLHRTDLKNKTSNVDVSNRLRLKERLNCKSFDWFLENVYTEKKYVYDRDVQAYGSIRNPITDLCIDNLNKPEDVKHDIGVYKCINANLNEWTNQMFSFMKSGEIRREETCLSVDQYATHKVVMNKCINLENISNSMKRKAILLKKLQTWKHTNGGQIINEENNLCLSTEGLSAYDNLRTVQCNIDDHYQIWWFQKYLDVNPKIIS